MIIVEVILSITAWRNGWKWWALLPMGICLSFGFLLGLTVGATVAPADNFAVPCLFGDLIAIVSLIIMTFREPSRVGYAPASNEPCPNAGVGTPVSCGETLERPAA